MLHILYDPHDLQSTIVTVTVKAKMEVVSMTPHQRNSSKTPEGSQLVLVMCHSMESRKISLGLINVLCCFLSTVRTESLDSQRKKTKSNRLAQSKESREKGRRTHFCSN